MSRLLALAIAITLGGTPVAAVLCGLTCDRDVLTSVATGCHGSDADSPRLGADAHDCDHAGSNADALIQTVRDLSAPPASMPASNLASLPRIDDPGSACPGASSVRSHASPPPLHLRI